MSDNPRLRVGLLIDGTVQPAWAARTIRDVIETADATLVLVVRPRVVDTPRTAATWHTFLWRAYQALDRRVFHPSPDPFEPVDVAADLAGIPTLEVAGLGWTDADVDAALRHHLDVAVDLGTGPVRGRARTIARLGVWAYHHADSRVVGGGPSGYREVALQHAVTGSELQAFTSEAATGHVIYRSWAGTDPRSVVRNNSHRYWKAAAFVRRALRAARELDPGEPLPAQAAGSEARGQRADEPPRNRDVAATTLSIGARFVVDKVPDLFTRDQWTLAYGMTEPPRPETLLETAARLTPLLPPADRFWADPFVMPSRAGWVLFFEELPFATGKGHISAVEISRDGTAGAPFSVLERDYHLSYPFVFEWNGTSWMIPETRMNGTIELYRAVDFPRSWAFDRVLLDGVEAVDATLAEIAGRWWMFAGIGEPGAWTDDELHLFHADTPLGPWTPHRHNPVKSDVRSARPAGRPFLHEGSWYRPAQDCSTRYGAAIVVNRIERITETEYREVEVARLDPVWRPGLNGTHTINFAGGLTVIDARVRRRRSS